MTPERKEYLMEHTGREATIRDLIRGYKHELKKCKAVCSSYDLKRIGRKPLGYRIHIVQVNETKLIIQALRHELQRLKGMDRVVVPKQTKHEVLPKTTSRPAIMSKPYFVCKCGDTVGFMMGNEWQKATYCTHCGRRILWEKVK